MIKNTLRYKYLVASVFLLNSCQFQPSNDENPTDNGQQNQSNLFSLLTAEKTRIHFQNTLTEGPNTNVLMYEYFFNGAGVSASDFNGDGLADIYFTSNMGDNQLYINRGNMRFEEVTKASGATGRPGPWKTGVTSADINGDGKLDIYISYSGMLPEEKRKNQLYINQGNDENDIPVFEEEAEKYGLASAAYSNQAYFFDYDKDGDLDAILLNHNPKALPILNEKETKEFLKEENPLTGIRVYEQSNGVFEDVTSSSGISSSALTYGLGIAIGDLNEDGWPDFYVCNDYSVPDYLYINNQDGTFTDRIGSFLNHTSLASMGNDIADLNNDRRPDIISLDMLPEGNSRQKLLMSSNSYEKFDLNIRTGFHKQYMRNMLQLNNGNGTFSEIGQLAGISNTDWSWSVLAADYDNDGWKDMYVTNGYYRDYTNMDFINYMNDYVSKNVNLKRADVLELNKKMPDTDIVNYMFRNSHGTVFSNATKDWGLDYPSKSNGAAYADLDNDGDLDLIINNINQAAFIYQNNADQVKENNYINIQLTGKGQNTRGIGAKVTIYLEGGMQSLEKYTTRGYLSSVSDVLHFGLGKDSIVDSLVVTWNSGYSQKLSNINSNQLITLNESESEQLPSSGDVKTSPIFNEVKSPITYRHPKVDKRDFDRQPFLISELSFSGPCLAKGDLNGDGLEDIFIGGSEGQAAVLYFQQADGRFILQMSDVFLADKSSVDTDAIIFDANHDGRNDIYVTSGGYHDFVPGDQRLQDRLYLNKGNGRYIKQTLPKMLTSTGCVAASDFNQDGHHDLFVGGRLVPGRYPEAPVSYLLINDGKGNYSDQLSLMAPGLQNIGMVTDAVWTDINKDELPDLIVIGEWMPVSVFINHQNKLEEKTSDYLDEALSGWWNVIEVEDLNGDNRPDLFLGNCGQNVQFKVSNEEPAELFYDDFGKNGSVDPVFTFYIKGKSYPYLTRDELISNLPVFRSQFPTYESYADAQITEIFGEKLDKAGHLKANRMESTLLLSREDGSYELASLPVEAQYAPVYSITAIDYDNDGDKDVLLAGNNSHFQLRLGSIDANFGILLQNDGQGGFKYVDQVKSGLKLKGDVRSNLLMDNRIFFGINEGQISVYELNEAPQLP